MKLITEVVEDVKIITEEGVEGKKAFTLKVFFYKEI